MKKQIASGSMHIIRRQWFALAVIISSLVSKTVADPRLEPLSPSLLKDLHADCTRDGINVKLWFKEPFTGVAYSHGHYETPKCRYISHEDQLLKPSGTNFSFLIPINECGTVYHGAQGSSLKQFKRDTREKTNDNEVYIENTLLIQNDPTIQEAGDLAKTLRCVWQKEIHKPLVASFPFGNVKPKLTPVRFTGETERIREIPIRNRSNYSVGTSAFSKGRLRFQTKGQIQGVPVYGRRHYSRALSAGDEDESSSIELEVEEVSSEEEMGRLRDHDEVETTAASASAMALPLQGHNNHVHAMSPTTNDGSRTIMGHWKSATMTILTLLLLQN